MVDPALDSIDILPCPGTEYCSPKHSLEYCWSCSFTDILLMRLRFMEILNKKHRETMARFSKFKNVEEEMDAFEGWLEMQAREPKRPKVEPQTPRVLCPACAAKDW